MGFLKRLFGKETVYTDMEVIEGHVEKYVGPIEMVFHELVSDRLHLDLIYVKSSEERPYEFICTMGMSALEMPKSSGPVRRCELCVALEPGWPLEQELLQDEANYWPLRALKQWARLTFSMKFQMKPFLSGGVSADVTETYPGSPYSGVYFAPPAMFDPGFGLCYSPDASVQFLQLAPMTVEETRFKSTQISPEGLWEKWQQHDPREFLIVKKDRASLI